MDASLPPRTSKRKSSKSSSILAQLDDEIELVGVRATSVEEENKPTPLFINKSALTSLAETVTMSRLPFPCTSPNSIEETTEPVSKN